jgi:hypothetical protein
VNQEAFEELVAVAASRAVGRLDVGLIGYLVLTQKHRGTPRIREPEMRHALAQVAEARGLHYGIEVPTEKKYRFTSAPGGRLTRGRHDLVFLAGPSPGAERRVLVELKEGRLAEGSANKAITKDFVKLLREPAVDGKSFLHILPVASPAALRDLRSAYGAAYREALGNVRVVYRDCEPADDEKWFSLFVLVPRVPGAAGGGGSELHVATLERFGDAVQSGLPSFAEPAIPLPLRTR